MTSKNEANMIINLYRAARSRDDFIFAMENKGYNQTITLLIWYIIFGVAKPGTDPLDMLEEATKILRTQAEILK